MPDLILDPAERARRLSDLELVSTTATELTEKEVTWRAYVQDMENGGQSSRRGLSRCACQKRRMSTRTAASSIS